MAHPRLIYIKNDGTGMEFFNHEQLMHTFRTYQNKLGNADLITTSFETKNQTEEGISHSFLSK